MLFFAWSLVQSAVNYARRQRLIAILQKHLNAPFAYETGLICRRISKKRFGDFLSPNYHPGPSTSTSLVKAPSEPFLNYDTSDSVILYRTEELEIVAVPKPDSLKIQEWKLFTTGIPKKSIFIPPNVPRVSFIAVLIPSQTFITGSCSSSRDGLSAGSNDINNWGDKINGDEHGNNKLLKIDANEVTNSDEQNDTGFLSSLLSSYANQIAFCRRKPNEILYETDLENFYNIIFQWSEGALFEFNGKGIVKEIHSVQLPNLAASDNRALAMSSSPSSSFSEISSSTLPPTFKRFHRHPYTLLEYLYLKDIFGDEIPSSWKSISIENNYYFNNSFPKNGFYRSDSALNRAISPTASFYKSRRALPPPPREFSNANSDPPRLPPLLRSPSPSISRGIASSSSPPIPAYIKHLRQQEKIDRRRTVSLNSTNATSSCSPSTTFDDLLEDIKFIDQSSIDTDNYSLKSLATARSNSNKLKKELEDFITVSNIQTPLTSNSNSNFFHKHLANGNKTSSNIFHRQISNISGKKLTKMTEKISKRIRMGVSSFGKELKPAPENITRKRFASLIPSDIDKEEMEMKFASSSRRRSLSPLTLSIIESHVDSTTLTNTSAIGAQSRLIANEKFIRRRSVTPTRRRFHSIPKRTSGLEQVEEAATPRPPQKPPTILVYTGNNSELYSRIFDSIQRIIPENTYTIFHLSSKALINDPWIDENAVCVLLADTKTLGDKAWLKLQTYFIHSGKILFLCQNNLLASLTNCDSTKKQANLLKSAFGNKNVSMSLGKDFENFLKKSMKTLNKNKEINETFHAKDLIGGFKYSLVIHKKQDQPLLLYMENSANNASALFSDATSDELVCSASSTLIADAMKRLKIEIVEHQQIPELTQAYFVCEPDRLLWDMNGLAYDEAIGSSPKLFFQSNKSENFNLPSPSSSLLPIEVCQRKVGFPNSCEFDVEKYYNSLKTKSLGKAILFCPVCETTMSISQSLLHAVPSFDGILVIAEAQTKGAGRSGNQWLSPKGSALFSFDFNIPLRSTLGKSATYIQHILAVSIVDAVITILDIEDFALKIKWPNDIYYNRLFKMGGILVTSYISGETLHCVIGAGINVANSKPTVCLNDMIPEGCDKTLTVEEVIAETMNKFEYYVNLFEKSGKQVFLKRYYQFWLHTREEINVIMDATTNAKERVIIRGLDTYGFLEVRSKQNGKVSSIHENGNSFDLMKGLIRPKNRA